MYKKAVATAIGIFILAIGIISFMILADTNTAFAASLEVVGDRLGLNISPDTQLFNMRNIAPGDTENSSVTVKNDGDSAFSIFLGSEKESGDEDLFQDLDITVENNEGSQSYYSGPLKGLNNVALGSVIPGREQKLNLSIHFPGYIGNELQGKSLSVKFVFVAQNEQNEAGSGTEDSNSGDNYSPDAIVAGDEDIPAGTAELTETIPAKESIELVEEPVQTEKPEKLEKPKMSEVADESVPAAGALPGTGGIPAIIISLAGAIIVLAGIKLKKQ